MPNGQGPSQVFCQLNQKGKLRLAHGKLKLRAACQKDKLEFKLFSGPDQNNDNANDNDTDTDTDTDNDTDTDTDTDNDNR